MALRWIFVFSRAIGAGISTPGDRQLEIAGGYDQTWLLRQSADPLRKSALVEDTESGRTILVSTTQPGLHVYTGNSLKGDTFGPGHIRHTRRSGLCLETQHFANSPNQPNFPRRDCSKAKCFMRRLFLPLACHRTNWFSRSKHMRVGEPSGF
jgi:galactose mutarotase-like enzyme